MSEPSAIQLALQVSMVFAQQNRKSVKQDISNVLETIKGDQNL